MFFYSMLYAVIEHNYSSMGLITQLKVLIQFVSCITSTHFFWYYNLAEMKEMDPNREKLIQADEAFSAIGRALKDVSPDNPFRFSLENTQREIEQARRHLEFEAAPEFTFKPEEGVIDEKVRVQIDMFVQLGFYTELGMTEEEYRASFPVFPSFKEIKSKRTKQKYSEPLVVETRLTPEQLLKRSNIKMHPDDVPAFTREREHIRKHPLKASDEPYLAYSTSKELIRCLENDNFQEGRINFYEGVMKIIQEPVLMDGEVKKLSVDYYEFDEETELSTFTHRIEIEFESKLFSSSAWVTAPFYE